MKLMLDPRTKLLILILINVVVFTSPDPITEMLCVGIVLLLLLSMGAYTQAAKGLLLYSVMVGLLSLCALFPNFFTGMVAMMILCFRKIVPTYIFATGLIATTKVSELISGLQKMRFPKAIIVPFAVTLRFFPTAREEFACIRDAMKLRGITLNIRNIFTRPLMLMECIFVPMILRSASIAEELSAAAVTRGIDSDEERTSICRLSLRWGDAAAAVLFSGLSVLAGLGGVGIIYG